MRLIDADDAIREIKCDLVSLWYASDIKRYEKGVEFAISRLEDMETIEAEPVKHGKWKVDKYYNGTLIRYECSVCGAKDYFDYSYCPDCGARMDGDQE